MARFKVARPNSEVNLRKWAPGRVAQLKLFLGHLEQAVNTSLAAQVAQDPKRKFSQFVPKIPIQNITVEVEFREIRFNFTPPKGLRNFLFYEYQISTSEVFFQFDKFESPQPSFVFGNLVDFTTYYLRARVVTKDGLVGPWSDTLSATTPFSQGFGLFDGREIKSIVTVKSDYVPVFEREYTAIGGKAYYSIDYEVASSIVGDEDNNLEWTDVEFRWTIDEDQIGQIFTVTAYGTNITTLLGSDMEAITAEIGSFPSDRLFLPGPFSLKRRGAFIQKFTTLNSGTQTIRLEAKVLTEDERFAPNDFSFNPATTSVVYGAQALITVKNFNIFEALVT